jgi:hypothetical protein
MFAGMSAAAGGMSSALRIGGQHFKKSNRLTVFIII